MTIRRSGKALAAIALIGGIVLTAAPAGAAKILSGPGKVPFTGVDSGMTLFGGSHGIDNTALGKKPDVVLDDPQAVVSTVPEPAGWLMMLLGFGLLGMMTRRTTPTLAEARRAL